MKLVSEEGAGACKGCEGAKGPGHCNGALQRAAKLMRAFH